jgi:IS30 family transposase
MYSHLTLVEREELYALQKAGWSLGGIAKRLQRDKGTLSRELKRNRLFTKGQEKISAVYVPCRAQEKAERRAAKQRAEASWKGPEVYVYVREHLREDGWSPEQIAGRYCLEHPGKKLTHETIYSIIYDPVNKKQKLWTYLHRQKKKRQKMSGRVVHRESRIPEAVSIDKRSKHIQNRKQVGHWETDNVVGKQTDKTALSVTVERKIKVAIISKVRKGAADKTHKLIARMSTLPQRLRRTMTSDNGSENTNHKDITKSLEMLFYYCHAYHSWERGTNENTNGRLRYFIPKGMSIDSLDEKTIQLVEWKLNSTPRKCLKWKTPLEVLEKILQNMKTSDRCTSS